MDERYRMTALDAIENAILRQEESAVRVAARGGIQNLARAQVILAGRDFLVKRMQEMEAHNVIS